MFEKVNPSHPDKVADRMAGAIVDYAYTLRPNARVAVETLLGHGECHIIIESSVDMDIRDILSITDRLAPGMRAEPNVVPQDIILASNQSDILRCGDNGIFKGVPVTWEQRRLTNIAADIYRKYPYDGKYIIDVSGRLARHDVYAVICQSHTDAEQDEALLHALREKGVQAVINPLGPWTGGPDVDCGATNRKLGSDMGDAVTGGGLHGKDLSKADVSVNIVCHLLAQHYQSVVTTRCAIGDEKLVFRVGTGHNITLSFPETVERAREYIISIGGFEKFAAWGLIRP